MTAKLHCVSKCSQCFRKAITVLSMLAVLQRVEVDPPGCDVPLGSPGHVSRAHLPSSEWQSKHRNHIKAAEPGHSAPVYWFVIFLQRLITVGFQRAGWPSARNLKVEVWNSCQAKRTNKQTNQSVAAKLHAPSMWFVGGNGKLMSYSENRFQTLRERLDTFIIQSAAWFTGQGYVRAYHCMSKQAQAESMW